MGGKHTESIRIAKCMGNHSTMCLGNLCPKKGKCTMRGWMSSHLNCHNYCGHFLLELKKEEMVEPILSNWSDNAIITRRVSENSALGNNKHGNTNLRFSTLR